MKKVTDLTFDKEVLNADGFVLVDFWAEWCSPCKQIADALDEIEQTGIEGLTIAKLDIDANPDTPGKYGVRGVPTLLMFSGGLIVGNKVGTVPKSRLVEWVASVMASSQNST